MKVFIILISFFFVPKDRQNFILEGKDGLFWRAYISAVDKNEFVVEFGGTSMKLGGEHKLFHWIDEKHIVAYSTDKTCTLTKKGAKFYLKYEFMGKQYGIILSNKKYTESIDLRRRVIFSAYDRLKTGRFQDPQIISKKFEEYKVDPVGFINNSDLK